MKLMKPGTNSDASRDLIQIKSIANRLKGGEQCTLCEHYAIRTWFFINNKRGITTRTCMACWGKQDWDQVLRKMLIKWHRVQQKEHRKVSHIDRNAADEKVDDLIHEWHTGSCSVSLSEFLGISIEEFLKWVDGRMTSTEVLHAREERKQRN